MCVEREFTAKLHSWAIMAKQTHLITFAYWSIFFLTVVSGVINHRPLNAATSVGGQTVFNCSSDATASITWLYTTDCNTAINDPLTDSNCNIISSQASHYRTEKSGFVCNLIVFDALLSLGGCFTCFDGFGAGGQYQAMLVIVDSNVIITPNSTDLISEEDVMITTNVSYRGPSLPLQPLPPSFYWTLQSNPSQNMTSYQGSTTNTSSSSYIVVTVQPPNVPPHNCNLFFNAPVNMSTSCASNAPTFRTSWVTPTYPVSHNLPPNIMATPHFESDICEAKTLSCQPNAYPLAETYWVDVQQNINIYKLDITAEYMDEYLCVATNFYRNTSYQSTTAYSLSDRGQFSLTPCQFAESNKVEIILPSDARCNNLTCTCPCCTETVLKCSASTLPEAEYRWLFGDTETEGPTIEPTADGIYTCIAHNTVSNQRFNGNKSIRISQFYEFLPSSPATDETAVIVLGVLLAISILVIIGLVTWIVFWLLPKMRLLQGSTSSPDDNSSRQAAYESVVTPNTAFENAPYESLQQPTAPTYQELTMRHISEDDVIIE